MYIYTKYPKLEVILILNVYKYKIVKTNIHSISILHSKQNIYIYIYILFST